MLYVPPFFDESLWSGSFAMNRSAELTPLYIHRYRGAQVDPPFTFHPFWEVVCSLGQSGKLFFEQVGGGREKAETKVVKLKKNTVCLIPPHISHRECSLDEIEVIWLGFQAQHLPFTERSVCAIEDGSLAVSIEKLWLFSRASGEVIGPELDGMTQSLVAFFLRLHGSQQTAAKHDLGARVIRYLEEHFAERLSMPHLAQHFGCSEGYLHRCFREKTAASPMAYLKNIRIQQAMWLLSNSHLPVAQIAVMTGYEDPAHFSRVYHQSIGQTPVEYRQKNQPHASS